MCMPTCTYISGNGDLMGSKDTSPLEQFQNPPQDLGYTWIIR